MGQLPPSIRKVRGFLRDEYRRAFRHDHWHVGVVDAPIHTFLDPMPNLEVRWLPLPDRGMYLADPFGLQRGTAIDILFEEFDFRSDKGFISTARFAADGRVSGRRTVLKFPFHASYPFLVERKGSVYCIPETAQAHEVALYRATSFPDRWTKVATLLPGVAGLDSTVFEYEDRFWLMCTDLDDGAFSKLRIWHAPDLLGPWQRHAMDPAKIDVASARPAGTPFVHEGVLYRPAQDSSRTYGGAVAVNRVLRLTPDEFREERAAVIAPFRDGPYSRGIHTLSAVGGRTLVDGKRHAFHPPEMVRSLREGARTRWQRAVRPR